MWEIVKQAEVRFSRYLAIECHILLITKINDHDLLTYSQFYG